MANGDNDGRPGRARGRGDEHPSEQGGERHGVQQSARHGPHMEFGSGAAGGFGYEGQPMQRGSYGGEHAVGNRGDYSYLGGTGEQFNFFGDQGNNIPAGTGGMTGPYSSNFGSGDRRDVSLGTAGGLGGVGGARGFGGVASGLGGGTVQHFGGYGDSGQPYRQNFAGRGPRGYVRADNRIAEDICEALTRHPEIDARAIDVRVEGGEVTLEGTVEDRRAKRLAEMVAEECSGVHDVHNRLRIR